MKAVTAVIAAAAISAIFYLGHAVNHSADTFGRRIDAALLLANRMPSIAGASSEEAVKRGFRQADKEIVGAPAEIGKTIVENTKRTTEKAYKDTVKEISRAPKNVSKAVGRAVGLW